jgi:hypothetical protein
MFCRLLASDESPTQHRVNTDLITYIASKAGGNAGQVVVDICFCGTPKLTLTLDQREFDRFLTVLRADDARKSPLDDDGPPVPEQRVRY